MDQGDTLKAVEDLITTTNRPSQLPTNLKEVDKGVVGAKLTRDDM